MFIDDPYYAGQKIKFWIYFTNWGLILLNTRLFMGALFFTEASKLHRSAQFLTAPPLLLIMQLIGTRVARDK